MTPYQYQSQLIMHMRDTTPRRSVVIDQASERVRFADTIASLVAMVIVAAAVALLAPLMIGASR